MKDYFNDTLILIKFQLIDKLLENLYGYQYLNKDFKYKKKESSVNPINLSYDTQTIGRRKKSKFKKTVRTK